MSSDKNVLKLEKDKISEFQKELHFQNMSKNDEPINSRFSAIYEKTSWSIHKKVLMPRTTGKQNEIIYTCNKKYDYLTKSELHTTLPTVRVHEKYKKNVQICWSHKVFHHINGEASLMIDDDLVNSIDPIWLDIHSQMFEKMGVGKRNSYSAMIGDLEFLTDWNSQLPEFPIILPQPWFYNIHESHALPILQSSMNRINHIYKFNLEFENLIRMRIKKKDGTWKNIKFNRKYLQNNETLKIPIPEMWGRFSLLTDPERNWHKERENIIYIDDILSHKNSNPAHLGECIEINLESKSPCKALFWVAENLNSSKYNNLSNYTTNSENIYNGWNPCAMSSIQYESNIERSSMISNGHYDLSEPYNFFPSAPSEPGYNGYSFSYDPVSLNADTAVVLGNLKASLLVRLNDINPFHYEENIDEEQDEEGNYIPTEAVEDKEKAIPQTPFNIHVRLLVIKKLKITWKGGSKGLLYQIIDQ